MHDDLLNAVSALAHRHVLVTLHALTGAMLAQLDAGGEVDLGGKAPTPGPTKPMVAAASPKPSTLERRARLVRAKQRQAAANAATGAAAPVTAEEDPWLALRSQFHAEIRRRHLTRGQIAAELGVSKGSVCGWLVPTGAQPSAANMTKIRAWLDEKAPQPAPAADWLALREQLRGIVRERALTHAELGRVFEVEGATVGTWLAPSHEKRMPGARFLLRIEQWLREGAVMPASAAADAPPFVLSVEERDQLTGHLSLAGNGRELRERFGATPELLQKAASGGHLAAEIVTKLRTALVGNGADAG